MPALAWHPGWLSLSHLLPCVSGDLCSWLCCPVHFHEDTSTGEEEGSVGHHGDYQGLPTRPYKASYSLWLWFASHADQPKRAIYVREI